MQDIRPDLRAPLDSLLAALQFRLLLLTFFQFNVVQSRAQDTERILPVVLLRPCLGILDHDPRRNMTHTHARLHLVHVLAAVPAGAEGIPFEIRRIYFNVDGIIDKRIDENR